MRILVTGGAGFVGSSLSIMLSRDRPDDEVVAFDNLRRRGSELTLPRLAAAGVEFVHGDIRNREDLEANRECGLLIDCSAEPSVQAGYGCSPAYVVNTNLMGTVNCLEVARRWSADMVFLSTSRVYPIAGLRALPLQRAQRRFTIPAGEKGTGWSESGISEEFPLAGGRSIYGATKLCSELLIEEYRSLYGLRSVVNRCGVLSGPWQMGKIDQGFFVLWIARHFFGGTLDYIGFGGEGQQVRDVLHIADLYDLLRIQLQDLDRYSGRVFNVGGGAEQSVSLAELSDLCREKLGRAITIGSRPETHPADVPYYVSDNAVVTAETGWAPSRGIEVLMADIQRWLDDHSRDLEPILT